MKVKSSVQYLKIDGSIKYDFVPNNLILEGYTLNDRFEVESEKTQYPLAIPYKHKSSFRDKDTLKITTYFIDMDEIDSDSIHDILDSQTLFDENKIQVGLRIEVYNSRNTNWSHIYTDLTGNYENWTWHNHL